MTRNAFTRILTSGTRHARRRKQRHRMDVQALEERTLLAGNVIASFGGGNLKLRGDNLANHFSVSTNANGIVVAGFFDTTVNGQATQEYSGAQFVPGNLKITAKGGDDSVLLDVAVEGNAAINMGGGSDLYGMAQADVAGNLKVNAGSSSADADEIILQHFDVSGSLIVKGGKGRQVVSLDTLHVGGKTAVSLGGGDNDELNIHGTLFGGPVQLNGGGGDGDTLIWPGSNLTGKGFEIFE